MRVPSHGVFRIAAVLVAAIASSVAHAAVTGAPGFAIDGYSLVDSKRVSRTSFDYTYKADVSNWGTADALVTATLGSTASNVTVVQGSLDFGSVAEGESRQSLGTFVVRVDRTRPFDPGALSWNVHAAPLPPTTFALIDAALAAGAIDAETALVYKVFSEFRDPRLPAQYAGREGPGHEATALEDAIESYETLSAPTQTLLRPFLLPPEDPGSWYRSRAQPVQPQQPLAIPLAEASTPGCEPTTDPASGTVYDAVVPTANGKVCVHYFAGDPAFAGDDAVAAGLAAEINDVIWPSLTHLFREPPLDANGFLQVYLVNSADMTRNYKPGSTDSLLGLATICHGNTPHIFLNRDRRDQLDVTAAHELLHAITAGYAQAKACGESRWMGEATATWAEHFVYPCGNSEQPFAPSLLNAPSVSLEDATDRDHPYGAYLWFLEQTKVVKSVSCTPGSGSAVPEYAPHVWSELAINDSLHAIDAAVNDLGGLTKKWHDFVLDDWNRDQSSNGPYVSFWLADRLKHRAREAQGPEPLDVRLAGAVVKTYPMPHTVRHLGATYFHFDFTKDDTIRRIRLIHPYSSTPTDGNVKVQAIVKTDGGWQKAADWTGFPEKTLCRDKSGEHFKELVIVISNSEFDDRTFVIQDDGSKTKLRVSALGCSNWQGDAQGTFQSPIPSDTIDSSTDAQNVTFERSFELWTDTDDIQQFQVKGGSVNWTYHELLLPGSMICTGDFSGNYGLASASPLEAQFSMGSLRPNGPPEYSIAGAMVSSDEGGTSPLHDTSYPLTCTPPPDQPLYPDIEGSDGVALWILTSDGTSYPGINDTAGGIFAGKLAGSFILKDSAGSRTLSWLFSKSGTFDDP